MNRLTALAASAALSALLPSATFADEPDTRRLGALPVSFDSLRPADPVLALMTTGEIQGTAPRHRPSAGRITGLRQIVTIDGTLMAIDADFLRQQVAAGALTVVFPGSKTPWSENASAPAYPPAWFLEDASPATGG